MNFLDTKLVIADALCTVGESAKLNKVGRPSSAKFQQTYENKKRNGTNKRNPQTDVQKDGFDHLQYWQETGRSRSPGCTGKTYIICIKCQIPS
nr:unnamed protein product [Callosobruchus analis]